MEVSSAVTLVNCLVYKPGWEISATDHTGRFEGAIQVHLSYPVHLYNRADAPDYTQTDRPSVSFPVLVGDFRDDHELYGAVLDLILRIEEHEAREALRCEPTYWSPFHPHKADGIRRWVEHTRRPDREAHLRDLTFGLA